MLEHNRVICCEILRDFCVIWLTVVVKPSPIHWFGGLDRYAEVVWRATSELRVGVLGMDGGGSNEVLAYARACSCATLYKPVALEIYFTKSRGIRVLPF